MSAKSKYSPEFIAQVKQLRGDGWRWREIAEKLGHGVSSLKNAVFYQDGAQGVQVVDGMPKQIKKWPHGVNFSPDELQVRRGM